MRTRNLFFIPLLLLSLSCNSNHSFDNVHGDVGGNFESITVPATHQPPPPKQSNDEAITTQIIKNGSILFQSKAIEKDYQQIKQLLGGYGAYIENERQTKSEYRITYDLIIRVAANKYDSLFNAFAGLGVRLNNKSSTVEDVTERYYDLKTRVRNQKALEDRYVELLQKATEVKDILEIERQINEVRTTIEQLEGQFNYLSKQISLSTINLSFYEELPYTYASIQREGFGARLLSAFDSGWQMFVSFVIGVASFWPFFLLIAAGVIAFRRVRKKRRAKKLKKQEVI